ncbi:MAG: MFS transporter [Chitinophagales bacterium]
MSGVFNVIVLGLVSFFTDASSEMVYPLMPLYLARIGAGPAVLGLIEGLAETTASLLKVFSGYVADRFRRRKPLTIAGYAASPLGKLFIAASGSWPMVLVGRMIDRFGKGVRNAPRDALLAEACPPERRGFTFGLHRAMDTLGAVVGTGLAIYLLTRFNQAAPATYRKIFLVSLIPAALGVAALGLLKEERGEGKSLAKKLGFQWSALDRRLKAFLIFTALFTLGNSSNMFLLLRADRLLDARHVANPALVTLGMYLVYNLVYALVSLPAGHLSDKIGRKALLVTGYAMYGLVYIGFALVKTPAGLWTLFAAYGLYIALTEGVEKALVADVAPPHLRATMIGLHATLAGIGLYPASQLAGLLWQFFGASAPFYFGGVLGLAAAAGLALVI